MRTRRPASVDWRLWIPLLILLIGASARAATPAMTAEQRAFHLLNRLAYGPRQGEVEALAKSGDAGIETWLTSQLDPSTIADLAVDRKLAGLKSLTMSIGELHRAFPRPKGNDKEAIEAAAEKMDAGARPRRILVELVAQKLIRAVESRRQFQEVIVDFWFNHFNVDFNKGQDKWFLTAYERDTIRPHVFGKFRDLLGAVARSPAMLFYLDNFQSVRDGLSRGSKVRGLNENYGRELLELHTLGVDGGYAQADVRETARAFTGWTLEQPQRAAVFRFRPRAHDPDAKRVLGLSLPAGGGMDDGEKVLDYLARHPATAHFIARKLCVEFISDHPPESAVKKLAATFQRTDGDLHAVYRELFHLPEFWASARMKVKTPWEFEVSAARITGSQVSLKPHGMPRVYQSLEQMGQPLYRCQPPTGFRATSEFWVNPGALATRISFALALAGDRVPELDTDAGYYEQRLQTEGVPSLALAITRLGRWILPGELGPETRKSVDRELASDETGHLAVNLPKLTGLLLGSPEFQRR